MELKGKEKQIGIVAGVVVAIIAGIVGFSSDAFKAGFCGEPELAKVEAPTPTLPAPAPAK